MSKRSNHPLRPDDRIMIGRSFCWNFANHCWGHRTGDSPYIGPLLLCRLYSISPLIHRVATGSLAGQVLSWYLSLSNDIDQYWLGSHLGWPILFSAPCGEGTPPCVLASRRWEPTYIASYTHTLGSWVDFFMEFDSF